MNGASGGVKNCSAEWAGERGVNARRKRAKEAQGREETKEFWIFEMFIRHPEGDRIRKTSWIWMFMKI